MKKILLILILSLLTGCETLTAPETLNSQILNRVLKVIVKMGTELLYQKIKNILVIL